MSMQQKTANRKVNCFIIKPLASINLNKKAPLFTQGRLKFGEFCVILPKPYVLYL